jgi:hypothetical protein
LLLLLLLLELVEAALHRPNLVLDGRLLLPLPTTTATSNPLSGWATSLHPAAAAATAAAAAAALWVVALRGPHLVSVEGEE